MVTDFALVWMLKNQRNHRICIYMLMTADILNCQMYGHTWPHIETSSWAKNHIAELAVALNHTKNRNQKKWAWNINSSPGYPKAVRQHGCALEFACEVRVSHAHWFMHVEDCWSKHGDFNVISNDLIMKNVVFNIMPRMIGSYRVTMPPASSLTLSQ